MTRSTRPTITTVLLLVGLMAALAGRGFSAPAVAAPTPTPDVTLPELPKGPFISVSPTKDKIAVNLPVWLAVAPSVWRPVAATTDVPPSTTTTVSTAAPPSPTASTATTIPPQPTRVTVTLKPLYVDWDFGDGAKLRCFDPGNVYNPNLPLSTQTPTCSKHTYVRPHDEVTIKAAVTYGTMVLVEPPNGPPREEAVGAQVARDELKISVKELQAVNPGLSLKELLPTDNNGQAPAEAQVPPPPEFPDTVREGEYFPKPPSGWDKALSIGGTILKVGAVVVTGVVVAAAAGAFCAATLGVGCVVIGAVVGGIAAGGLAGGLFCGATAECIGKGALSGGVAALAAVGAVILLPEALGVVATGMIAGAVAGAAGNLTDQLVNIAGGGKFEWKSFVVSTAIGAVSGGLLAKFAPGLMSRFKLGGRPPPVEEPVVARPPTGEGPPPGRPIDIENARFAQKTYGEEFDAEGTFAGRTIDDVAGDLRSEVLSPKDVKIEVITRDGNDLILNTRSSEALERAGIPRSEWNVVDVTGNPGAESRLTNQLKNNKLDNSGIKSVP